MEADWDKLDKMLKEGIDTTYHENYETVYELLFNEN